MTANRACDRAASKSTASHEAVAKRVPAVDAFRLRCEARAILVAEGAMDFHEAVDGLQAAAVAYGLIDDIGQDEVQKLLAEAFATVPR